MHLLHTSHPRPELDRPAFAAAAQPLAMQVHPCARPDAGPDHPGDAAREVVSHSGPHHGRAFYAFTGLCLLGALVSLAAWRVTALSPTLATAGAGALLQRFWAPWLDLVARLDGSVLAIAVGITLRVRRGRRIRGDRRPH